MGLMKQEGAGWTQFFDLRKTILLIVIAAGLLFLNQKWLTSLDAELEIKKHEYAESKSLLSSKQNYEGREKDLENFAHLKEGAASGENWTDAVPVLVADQRLILRQVRPLGIEQVGGIKTDQLFLQVDGSIQGFLGFLHALSSLEKPVYVSRFLVSARSIGTGFVSAELVLSKLVLD